MHTILLYVALNGKQDHRTLRKRCKVRNDIDDDLRIFLLEIIVNR